MTADIFLLVFGFVSILIAAFTALGISIPRLRGRWKGTVIACGPLSCAGAALSFASIGLVFVGQGTLPSGVRLLLGACFMIGWIVGNVGHAFDRRTYVKKAGIPATIWGIDLAFAAFGVWIIVVMLFLYFFHQ